MYCWKCRSFMLENERYCPDCGAAQCHENGVKETGQIVKEVAVKTGKAIKKYTTNVVVEVTASVLTEAVLQSGEKAGKAVMKKIRKRK